MTKYIGINPGGWGSRFWAGSRGVVAGGQERVSEKTIAYFAQKGSFFVFFKEKEKN